MRSVHEKPLGREVSLRDCIEGPFELRSLTPAEELFVKKKFGARQGQRLAARRFFRGLAILVAGVALFISTHPGTGDTFLALLGVALMQGSRLGRKQRMCTWKMTTKEPLPSLSYELEVTVDAVDNQHMSAELQAAIVKLRESQGTRYLEAAHELRANDPSYSATVEKISLDPPNGLFIVLNSEEDYYRVLQGVASHDEFERCADLICSGASGDVLTGFAFPQISRSLTSYELKNSMF